MVCALEVLLETHPLRFTVGMAGPRRLRACSAEQENNIVEEHWLMELTKTETRICNNRISMHWARGD